MVAWLSLENSSLGGDGKIVCRGGEAEGRDWKAPPQVQELKDSPGCPLSRL